MRTISSVSLVAAGLVAAAASCLLSYPLDHYGDGRNDAGANGDAVAADAADAGASCEGGFCDCNRKQDRRCYDFDTQQSIAHWLPLSSAASVVDFVTADAIWPPKSLRARVAERASLPPEYAYLELIDQPSASKMKVELDIVVDEFDTTPSEGVGVHGFCPINIMMLPSESVIRLNLYEDRADIEQLVKAPSSIPVPMPRVRGTKARIGLWFDVAAGKCGATFGGADLTTDCKLDPGFSAEKAKITIGIPFNRPPTSAWAIRADNVTIDFNW